VSAAVSSGPERAEAVAALANMTAAALRSGAGGCGERRAGAYLPKPAWTDIVRHTALV
jgi:hypothetical protein